MTQRQQSNGLVRAHLHLRQRLGLVGILPAEGGLVTVRLVNELRSRLLPSATEIETIHLVQDGDRVTWDRNDRGATYSFSGFEVELIISRLRELETAKKMTPELLPLWDVFVEGKQLDGEASPES